MSFLLPWPGRSALPGLLTLALLAFMTSSVHADSTKAWGFKPDRGFVDEAVAFSADDTRFAYLHTDAAEFLKLLVLRTDGFTKESEINIDDPTRIPRQLAFTPDGARLTLVSMDGHSGACGAVVYDLKTGKPVKKLGPATTAVIADCGGEQCVSLTTTKQGAQGTASHAVVAFRTRDLRRVGAASLTVQPDQTLKAPPLRLLYFEPGNLSLVGMQKGKYDKKRDIRLPEREVRWSLLARKELRGQEPKELLSWTRAVNMRPNHPGQYRFLQVSEDLKQLLLVDRDNMLATISVPVRWVLYEPKSLVQAESADGKTLHFSLTIDPVNKEAVRRKKADKERVDIFRLDEGRKAVPIGQVETGKRGFVWSVGRRHFAYLRKLKGFGRGGTEVELHRSR